MHAHEPIDESRPSRRWLYLAVAAALVIVAASAWWPADVDTEPPVIPVAAAPQASPSPFGSGPAVTGPDRAPGAEGGMASGTAAPPRDAAIASADDYRTLMETFDERVRRNAGDPSLKPMASQLDARLDEQLANFQVEPGEALMLKADILDVLVGERRDRGPALLAWMRKQPIFQVPIGEPDDAEVQAYQRGEAEIVMSWQALPPPDRDPEELESQLDRLLLESFSLESS